MFEWNYRWAKMAKLCWTSCSDLWPLTALTPWQRQQITPKRCTMSWTLSMNCCIIRDSWKTSGNTAKCGFTSGCSSVSSSRMSSRYFEASTSFCTVYLLEFWRFFNIKLWRKGKGFSKVEALTLTRKNSSKLVHNLVIWGCACCQKTLSISQSGLT